MYWYADIEDRKIKLNTFLGAVYSLLDHFFFFNIVQFQKISIGVWGGGVCKSKKCKKKSIPPFYWGGGGMDIFLKFERLLHNMSLDMIMMGTVVTFLSTE